MKRQNVEHQLASARGPALCNVNVQRQASAGTAHALRCVTLRVLPNLPLRWSRRRLQRRAGFAGPLGSRLCLRPGAADGRSAGLL